MGVVNITPDSFSDGGHFLGPAAAVAQALQLLEEGADIVDLGAESTRPGRKKSRTVCCRCWKGC
jgi:dihydropteroate synthase